MKSHMAASNSTIPEDSDEKSNIQKMLLDYAGSKMTNTLSIV